ncbi:MAG: hypothetical protein L3J71_03635 [Victivallaceae bacterium]|nr:hypothetical protein [Victivallaceae bacterium]
MQAQLPTGTMTLQFAAGLLQADGFETGPGMIFRQLRDLRMIEGGHASRKAIEMDWLYERDGEWERGGMHGEYTRVFMTRSGLAELERRWKAAMPVILPQQPINLGMDQKPLGF